jgi:hypothetical protein
MLFKVTSWLLLALAWTWVMLEWVPLLVVRHVSVDGGENLTESEYLVRELSGIYEGQFRVIDYIDPHPALVFVRDYRLYVFVAGILAAVWCYLFIGRVRSYLAARPASLKRCSPTR